MNATKFIVLLVIGVLFAIVSARVVEEVSKETKLAVSIPKTTTKGFGAELSAKGATDSDSSGFSYASASKGPKDPRADSYGRGYVAAKGRKAHISSSSGSRANGNAGAAADRKGATAGGYGYGASGRNVKGRSSYKKKGRKGKKN